MKDFKGKTVVITGAATGIGRALAAQFAQRGARLVLAGRRQARLDEVVSAMREAGHTAEAFACDVTNRAEVEALADFAEARFGTVDVVVNNAGVGPNPASVIETEQADVQAILDVNLFGAWNGVSVFGKRFIARSEPSAIFNVGSENCFFNAVPLGAGYVASKHALLAMTVALREELPAQVSVGLICPGLVQSELSPETAMGMETDAYAALVMRQIEAGSFYIVSHAYNAPRIHQRFDELLGAYDTYAPRYPGDHEFDVRALGLSHDWYPPLRASLLADPLSRGETE